MIATPASMRDPDEIAAFQALDLDAAAVVAFGQILPAAVLDAPRLGSFNLHGSLLPRWRGAAPIQRAVMAGDPVTGVEVMRMTEGLDEGPVLASETLRIGPLDTGGTMHDRMAAAGPELLARTLAAVARGEGRGDAAAAGRRHLRQEDPAGRRRPGSTGQSRAPRSTAGSAACRRSRAPGSPWRPTRGRRG